MTKNDRNLEHRLARYSLAASAVGLAAGTSPADAAIVFSDNGGAGWTVTDGNSINFNYAGGIIGTGTSGLEFENTYPFRLFRGDSANQIVRSSFLNSGSAVSVGQAFISYTRFSYFGSGQASFDDPPVSSAYLGLRFGSGGTYNYGWLDITLDDWAAGTDTIVINGIAVESTANTPITVGDTGGGGGGGGSSAVPEPGTLALLVLGATGLTALRRRET